MPTAGHLLAIYRTRRDMQRQGTTSPAPSVRRFCEQLVNALEELPPETPVRIAQRPSGRADFVAEGRTLATMPADDEILLELRPAFQAAVQPTSPNGEAEPIEVPDVSPPNETQPDDEDPVAFADRVLGVVLQSAPAFLAAEFDPAEPHVSWLLHDRRDEHAASNAPHEIGRSTTLGGFRRVLARFGHRYMGDQLYGGHAMPVLTRGGRRYSCAIFMSNAARTDFWIRVYTLPLDELEDDRPQFPDRGSADG